MIHREGYPTIFLTILVIATLHLLTRHFELNWAQPWVGILSAGLLVIVLQFFRNPTRSITNKDEHLLYAPADGKIVVIEKVHEREYYNDERLMVSVFMSPLNVHVNRVPISGKIAYRKYHPGKYLVAWHPKSSEENERTTVVIDGSHGTVLLRQIAGALARRIVNYMNPGEEVRQGQEMGFIKFGSRVDIFLPLDAKVMVEMGQVVKGNQDVIAKF